MRRLTLFFFLLSFVTAWAQDPITCSDEEFRALIDSIVSEGNRQYERSNKDGIVEAANKLAELVNRRGDAGKLDKNDQRVAYVDWNKLAGDWYYEDTHYNEESYQKSREYFDEALAAIRRFPEIFQGKLDYEPMILRELAQLCYKMKQYDEALQHTQTAIEAFDKAADMGFLTEEDDSVYLMLQTQLAICQARTGKAADGLKLIDSVLKQMKKGSSAYYETLRKKAKIIMLGGEAKCNAKALPLYKQYLDYQKGEVLRTLLDMTTAEREDYWMRMRPFIADCYQLESTDAAFLFDVTLFAKGLLLQLNLLKGKDAKQVLKTMAYSWREIQKRLSQNACAVEFVQYEKGGVNRMGALVLGKKGVPQWAEMMTPDQVLNHVCDEDVTVQQCLYATSGEYKDLLYGDKTLTEALWTADFRKKIAGCKKLYFAPDGYFHQIALEYIAPEEFAETKLYRLTSTRRLLSPAAKRNDSRALILGGVEYDEQNSTDNNAVNDTLALRYMRYMDASFTPLRGAKMECDTIYKYRENAADTLLMGDMATEQAFRELCNDYSMIHLSTHGCFTASYIPQGTDLKGSCRDESLSESVIALAGANRSVSDPLFDSNALDGILSAREISETDMSNVDFVVISACQTGLGYVTADGVYGMQRGLKNAGVDAMSVTLWNVNDYSSYLWMTNLFKEIKNGLTIYEAFHKARRELATYNGCFMKRFNAARLNTIENQLLEVNFNMPQYLNSFILIDAIE